MLKVPIMMVNYGEKMKFLKQKKSKLAVRPLFCKKDDKIRTHGNLFDGCLTITVQHDACAQNSSAKNLSLITYEHDHNLFGHQSWSSVQLQSVER